MKRIVKFVPVPEEEQYTNWHETGSPVVASLIINPSLDMKLIEQIREIKGTGWVEEESDYAAITKVYPEEILLESGCHTWCEHMENLVSKILDKRYMLTKLISRFLYGRFRIVKYKQVPTTFIAALKKI